MLVVFALGETILFTWVFGMQRGWDEMMKGAELQIPLVFRYIMQYVTPVFLLVILFGSVFQPQAGWHAYVYALARGESLPAWNWDGGSVVGKLLHLDVAQTRAARLSGIDREIVNSRLSAEERIVRLQELEKEQSDLRSDQNLVGYEREARILKLEQQSATVVEAGKLSEQERQARQEELLQTRRKADLFYSQLPTWRNIDRVVMVAVYVFFSVLVCVAWRRRATEGRV
jgi:hypothetical protein